MKERQWCGERDLVMVVLISAARKDADGNCFTSSSFQDTCFYQVLCFFLGRKRVRDTDVVWQVEYRKLWVVSQVPYNMGQVVQICNPRIQEVGAGESEGQAYSWLHCDIQTRGKKRKEEKKRKKKRYTERKKRWHSFPKNHLGQLFP